MHCGSRPARAAVAAAVVVAAFSATACAWRRGAEPAWPIKRTCDFVVYNRTPHAIEVRMWIRSMHATWLGAINPGEHLPHSVPCDVGSVWLTGVAIPPQVGGLTRFRSVANWADLIEGVRVDVSLTWPEAPHRHLAWRRLEPRHSATGGGIP